MAWGTCGKCDTPWTPGHRCLASDVQARTGRRGWYGVKVGWTPGVFQNWKEAKAEIDKLGDKAVYKKFDDIDAAIDFIGGDDVSRAWDLFRAGKLGEAQVLFTRKDLSGHGAHHIGLERARLAKLAAAADTRQHSQQG